VNLVTQVLEPTIGNYFRNAAQGSDVIEFLRLRSQRQKEARESAKTVREGEMPPWIYSIRSSEARLSPTQEL